MAEADYRLMTEATGQRIAAALEALSGTGAAAAAARTNLDVYSKGETDNAIAQSTATLGSKTEIGSRQGPGDIVLREPITNFKYIMIRIGYYASGYTNYGSILIPVSCISLTSDPTYDYTVVCYEFAVGAVILGFTNTSTCHVTRLYDNNRYVSITGIK